ncbi:MAG: bacteriophage Mu, partial [bacterium]|nr:bacteriophage Mu [bacterium]
AGIALERGVNVLRGKLQFSFKERFSKYIVKGQGQSNDQLWGEATRLKAETTDPAVARYRPLIVIAEDLVDGAALKRRAAWEANVRAGKSAQLAYKVQGWSYGAGTLWQPNTIVHVTDPWLRTDADLLVKNVTFNLDDGGSVTELALTPPQTFDLIPMPRKPADTWDLLSKQQTEIQKLKRAAEKGQK